MLIVIAPDKFKGSLTARQVADALADGVLTRRPDWIVRRVPVADGGDGTVAAAVAAGWQPIAVSAEGPTGELRTAEYARSGTAAVVELAAAVGLVLLPGDRLEPLRASTFGLGTVIRHALDNGVRDIVIGLGGSASTDGGAGILQALGARILDAEGKQIGLGGAELLRAVRVDLTGLHSAAADTRFLLACDVDNPLRGRDGATAVYGPQKGANDADLRTLESAMKNWADIVATAIGRDLRDEPGAGAAGGAGFGALAVLGAEQRPGIDIVLELVDFRGALDDADLVITGEGSLDVQSLNGKTPIGVATAAREAGVPVIAVAGRSVLTQDQSTAAGFAAVHSLAELEPDLGRSMSNAAELLRTVGARIAEEFS